MHTPCRGLLGCAKLIGLFCSTCVFLQQYRPCQISFNIFLFFLKVLYELTLSENVRDNQWVWHTTCFKMDSIRCGRRWPALAPSVDFESVLDGHRLGRFRFFRGLALPAGLRGSRMRINVPFELTQWKMPRGTSLARHSIFA